MKAPVRVGPLDKESEQRFFDFLDRDRILHIFTIYDLKHMQEKTDVWVAFRGNEIIGYVFEFDSRIVHTHGDVGSITDLLRFISLDEPVFVIESHHLEIVVRLFEPVEPTDSSSKGKITKYVVMKIGSNALQSIIRHQVKRLGGEDLEEASKSLGEEWGKRVEEAIKKGFAFGEYHNGSLVSLATVPEIIENLAFVRGVYTLPSLRGRGLATSTCSALVTEVTRLGMDAVLWVANDNLPARKVYEKIGFKETGHVLLGFKARRRPV